MNNFYKQPLFLQWAEAILLCIFGFFPVIIIIPLADIQPLFYLLFVFYFPIVQFGATPLFTLMRFYTYYSPMLLGYMANDNLIDLHSGTSFDYVFVMRKVSVGSDVRNRLFLYYLEGLLNIIAQIEQGKIPKTVVITGTSYFFNEKTIARLGFESKEPTLFYRLNLMINFIDLTWMYSVSKGKVSFPRIWKVKKASIIGSKLVEHKDAITELHTLFTSRKKK